MPTSRDGVLVDITFAGSPRSCQGRRSPRPRRTRASVFRFLDCFDTPPGQGLGGIPEGAPIFDISDSPIAPSTGAPIRGGAPQEGAMKDPMDGPGPAMAPINPIHRNWATPTEIGPNVGSLGPNLANFGRSRSAFPGVGQSLGALRIQRILRVLGHLSGPPPKTRIRKIARIRRNLRAPKQLNHVRVLGPLRVMGWGAGFPELVEFVEC